MKLRRTRWKSDGDGGAGGFFRVDFDLALVEVNNLFDDMEAKTHPRLAGVNDIWFAKARKDAF